MVTLECNYSKKIGLPGYSSHQFSITLRTELSDVSQVHAESARLYQLLQNGVDSSIKEVGYLPTQNGNGHQHSHSNGNGNGYQRQTRPGDDSWKCSPKQKDLVLRIIEENELDKNQIEQLAQDRFGKGVKQLNRLEASGLIEELIEKYPAKNGRRTTHR